MKDSIKGIWDKVCAGATVAGEFAAKTAGTVSGKTQELYKSSKIKLKILDLTTDIDVLYKEIGRIIYAAHTNEETSTEELDERLLAIDEKMKEIEELRITIEAESAERICPECGKENSKDSNFCMNCGAQLN